MKTRHLLFLLFLLFCTLKADATRLELEQSRLDSLQQAITLLSDSLAQLDRAEMDQLERLEVLQRRLDLNQRLLEEANSQVRFLETDLDRIESSRVELAERAQIIRLQYLEAVARRDTVQYYFRRIVRELYISLPLPLGEQLLASNDLESLVRRHAFLKNLNRSVADRKEELLREIKSTTLLRDSLTQVGDELLSLEQSHRAGLDYQQELRAIQRQRLQVLESDRRKYNETLEQLRLDKQLWQAYLEQRRRAQLEIAQRVDLYRQAAANQEAALSIRTSERKYAEARLGDRAPLPSTPATDNGPEPGSLRPGNTPWPTSGIVSRQFGIHHDAATGGSFDNPGIDIRPDGAWVRAVAAGEVLEITWLPGFGQTVLLAHAENYYTVYAGLEAISVKPGQLVASLTALGSAGQLLHFEIWRQRTRLDPETYLTRSP